MATVATASTPLASGWDEYLTWLSFALPGMLARGNVDAMAHALRELPARGADGSAWEVCRVVRLALESGHYDPVARVPNYLLRKRA
jgi:hypothetical protein